MSVSPDLQHPLTASGRAVLIEVMRHGPLSRAELGGRLGLSPPSLTRLTGPLIGAGLLRETEVLRRARYGRPSRPVAIVGDARHFAGVRLTGDEAHGVLIDLGAAVVRRETLPMPARDPAAVVPVIGELASRLGGTVDTCTALGVTLGGDVRDRRVVVHAPFLGWDRVELADLVEKETGLPTVVDNDLVALTRAEHWFGRESRSHFALLTVGAGTGYGLVVHDELVQSEDAGVGLLGHVPLDPQGPRCSRGHRGCSAAMLTIPGITGAIAVPLGRDVTYDECLALAADGHPVAAQVVGDSARALGRLAALVANVSMATTVVLAGEGIGLARAARRDLDEGLTEGRDPRAKPVTIEILDVDFTQFARGAAVSAIQDWADPHERS